MCSRAHIVWPLVEKCPSNWYYCLRNGISTADHHMLFAFDPSHHALNMTFHLKYFPKYSIRLNYTQLGQKIQWTVETYAVSHQLNMHSLPDYLFSYINQHNCQSFENNPLNCQIKIYSVLTNESSRCWSIGLVEHIVMAGNLSVGNGKWFDAIIIRVELLLYRSQKWPTKMLQRIKLKMMITPQHILNSVWNTSRLKTQMNRTGFVESNMM